MSLTATVTPTWIQFYEAEQGIDLIFDLKTLNADGCTFDTLTDTPTAGYPKLFAEGALNSPFTLAATAVPGQYKHTTGPAEWPVDEVIQYFECYIEWRNGTSILLSDPFRVAVVASPTLNL